MTTTHVSWQTDIQEGGSDPAWDRFLATHPGGHYAQSSVWARVREDLGWDAARVVLHQDDQVLGGVQLLTKPVVAGNAVGYVLRGPVLAVTDDRLCRSLLRTLHRVARRKRIRYLVVQPHRDDMATERSLLDHGFRPDHRAALSTKTMVVDLSPEPDQLLARMKKGTRANIRRAARSDVRVRRGGEEDLPTFHRLLVAAGRRNDYRVPTRRHLETLWHALRPTSNVELLLAEYGGEAVSAMLAIPFGDTFFSRYIAWSGEHPQRKPNEALDWAAMRWARERGYRYYDFEGKGTNANVARYKAGFGGELRQLPGVFTRVHGPLLRAGYQHVLPRIEQRAPVARSLQAIERRFG